jgi:signal transduction histidine kinase
MLAKSGASIERNFDENLPAVRGVRAELTQVFVNLITNACQAFGDGGAGKLVLRASRGPGDRHVSIAVEDNGCGIAPANLHQIFEPFFTTKGSDGTGLGLSIVRYILDAHDARIQVESTPESGTRFVIELVSETR